MRWSGLHNRPDLKLALESSLIGREGIRRVSASTITSNVLVCYDPSRSLPDIVGVIRVAIQFAGEPGNSAAVRALPVEKAPGGLSSLWASLKTLLSPANYRRPGRAAIERVAAYAVPDRMSDPWYAVDAEQVARFWGASARRGLSITAVQERLSKYGPNIVPPGETRSAVEMVAEQFKSLPVLLLLGSAALSIATGGLADAVVIAAVVVLNAAIGVATELQAERTIQSLISLAEPMALVLRDGMARTIRGEDVVPGDVLLLARGSQIVADARLLESEELTVDESALTGESMPIEKIAHPMDDDGLPLADRLNMVHRGTVVTGGSGLAIVVATAGHTEIGRVQALIAKSQQPETPLQRQMRILGGQLVWFTGAVAAAVFGVGLLRGFSPLEMLKSAISLAVAAVPEGLPTVATFALAGGVRALLAHKVLVRRLSAVETLGGIEVVCFDKTGTLTLNQMAVVAVFAGMRRYTVAAGEFFDERKPVQPAGRPELQQMCVVSALCSDAEVESADGAVVTHGTATETALLRLALNAGENVAVLRARFPRARTIHRTEAQNYMITQHDAGTGRCLLALKGSPMEVLALSGFQMTDGAVVALTEADRKRVRYENERMASAALRVLGLAYADCEEGESSNGSFVWLGLAGIADPPREGLRELIQQFRLAGVRPVMVTGDQPGTAAAVARALGLNEGAKSPRVLDSTHLEQLETDEWNGILPRTEIFARVSPAHKLEIVRAYQRQGEVVAMTGDGVNDGPALKAADVGIALGQAGTRVAREVADLLLLDDNIHAMLPAIREGRRVREGLRKAVHYISATNLSEIAVMFTSIAVGMGQPFNPRQLLWINLISDVFPELALAVEPAHSDLMSDRPRDPRLPVIGRADAPRLGLQASVMSAAGFAAYAAGLSRYGAGPQASAMAFITLTAAQLLHGISARSERRNVLEMGELPPNRYLSAGLGTGFAILALSQFVPGLSSLLGTARIGLLDAALCGAAALGSFSVIEATKGLLRNEADPYSEPKALAASI